MPLVDDVATELQTAGHGTVKTSANNPAAWPIYRLELMDGSVNQQIAVLYGQGMSPVESFGPTLEAKRPGLQIIVRDADAESAMTKALAIWETLRLIKNRQVGGGGYYHDVKPLSEPFPMGKDGKGRRLVSCNYQVSTV